MPSLKGHQEGSQRRSVMTRALQLWDQPLVLKDAQKTVKGCLDSNYPRKRDLPWKSTILQNLTLQMNLMTKGGKFVGL